MHEKPGTQRRGWLKVYVTIDVASKRLLSLEVTEENTSDSKDIAPFVERRQF